MDLSDSSWKYFPDTGKSTGAYVIFYQGGTIDCGTHVPVPVAQSSEESEYNAEFTAGMWLFPHHLCGSFLLLRCLHRGVWVLTAIY